MLESIFASPSKTCSSNSAIREMVQCTRKTSRQSWDRLQGLVGSGTFVRREKFLRAEADFISLQYRLALGKT